MHAIMSVLFTLFHYTDKWSLFRFLNLIPLCDQKNDMNTQYRADRASSLIQTDLKQQQMFPYLSWNHKAAPSAAFGEYNTHLSENVQN